MLKTVIEVEFLLDHYEGSTGSRQEDVTFPPSPGRLLGALLSAAYRGESTNLDLALIYALCDLDDPVIVRPDYAVIEPVHSYCPDNFSSRPGANITAGDLYKFVGARFNGETGGKKVFPSSYGVEVKGKLFFLFDELSDREVATLASLCQRVPYLGTSRSPVMMTAYLEHDYRIPGTALMPVPVRTGIKMRSMSRGLISWYDDKYTALFSENSQVRYYPPNPAKIKETHYMNTLIQSDDFVGFSLPFKEKMSVDEAIRVGENIYGDHFIMTESLHVSNSGLAVGIGVTDKDFSISQDLDVEKYFAGFQPAKASVDINRWRNKSRVWISTIPFRAHHDSRVATWQAENAIPGLTVHSISKNKQYPSQANIENSRKYSSWYLIATTEQDVMAPLTLGDDGTGVMIPLSEVKGL